MTWASALVEFNQIAPNMLLYWAFLERAAKRGPGASSTSAAARRAAARTASSSSGAGATSRSTGTSTPARGGAAATPSPDDGAYSWGPRIWKRLPLGAGDGAGAAHRPGDPVSWRRQLPAYSPLPLGAVLAGAAGLVAGAGTARARRSRRRSPRTYGCDEVLLTDSGTGALTLAIRAALAGAPGGPVALPAYGCYDLATAADGAARARSCSTTSTRPRWRPISTSLRSALARGARAVVLAYWYGVPVDPEPVRARDPRRRRHPDRGRRAGRRRAPGAAAPLGSFGDLTVLSFGRGKGTTAGRGGALLARGAGAAAFARARGDVGRAARGVEGDRSAQGAVAPRPPVALRGAVGASVSAARRDGLPRAGAGARDERRGGTRARGDASAGRARGRGPARQRPRACSRTWAVASRPSGFRTAESPATCACRCSPRQPRARPRLSSHARALGIMPGYPLALCDLPGSPSASRIRPTPSPARAPWPTGSSPFRRTACSRGMTWCDWKVGCRAWAGSRPGLRAIPHAERGLRWKPVGGTVGAIAMKRLALTALTHPTLLPLSYPFTRGAASVVVLHRFTDPSLGTDGHHPRPCGPSSRSCAGTGSTSSPPWTW